MIRNLWLDFAEFWDDRDVQQAVIYAVCFAGTVLSIISAVLT